MPGHDKTGQGCLDSKDACPPRQPAGHVRSVQRGFTILEALVSIGVVSMGAVLALTTLVLVGKAGESGASRAQLTVVAQDVATALRASTQYDDESQLAALDGHTTTTTVPEPQRGGSTRSLTVTVAIAAASPGVHLATITVTAPDGSAATLQRSLTQEAPQPGSIEQPTPPPPFVRVPGGGGGGGARQSPAPCIQLGTCDPHRPGGPIRL